MRVMSYGRHRKPRWHDRPRAWLRAAGDFALSWLRRDWYEEGEELTDDHGNPIGGDLPPVEPQVIRTAKVGGVHLPLSGEFVSPWINCAFTPDVPRPVVSAEPGSGVVGPGYRQTGGQPAGKDGSRCDSGVAVGSRELAPPVAALSMWDQVEDPSPWTPRDDDTVIIAGPRIAAGRIALLAGTT